MEERTLSRSGYSILSLLVWPGESRDADSHTVSLIDFWTVATAAVTCAIRVSRHRSGSGEILPRPALRAARMGGHAQRRTRRLSHDAGSHAGERHSFMEIVHRGTDQQTPPEVGSIVAGGELRHLDQGFKAI